MKPKTLSLLLISALLPLCAAGAFAGLSGLQRDFTYKQTDGAVDVLRGGKLVARYVYKGAAKPYIYPLYAPNGEAVTRSYPMKNVAGEPTDHPHHRSFWIGYGDVNGVDFWAEGEKCGTIKQTSIDFAPLSPGYWAIHTKNDWIGPDGKKVCEDERRITFLTTDQGTLISTLISITASEGILKFGDSKEGFFAVRVAPGMQLKDGKGHILNSEGDQDDACWGKPARWCDYTGEVNGKTCGITIFDGPNNFGHPTYWHARDYGLLAANPFGGEAFTGEPASNSGLTVPPRRPLTFLYAVLVHDGKLDAAALDSYADYAVGKGPGTPDKPSRMLKPWPDGTRPSTLEPRPEPGEFESRR